MENKAMKFNPNMPVAVELSFDEPKTGDGQYGTWYLYGTNENIKGESGFFATQILHELLQGLGVKTGSKLVITKVVSDNKTTWDVKSPDGSNPVEKKSITNVISDVAKSMDANRPSEVKELSTDEKVNIMWDAYNKKNKKPANPGDDLPF